MDRERRQGTNKKIDRERRLGYIQNEEQMQESIWNRIKDSSKTEKVLGIVVIILVVATIW